MSTRTLIAVLALALGLHALGASETAGHDQGVFTAPPAPLAPPLTAAAPAAGGPLRLLTVEERVGVARVGELVRVPLFLHAGECVDPDGFAIFAADDAARARPIAYQADDVRRDPDGSVSRLHLWFATDLAAWERKRFVLVKGANPGAKLPAVPIPEAGGVVTLSGDDLAVGFRTSGPTAGSIATLASPLGALALPGRLLAPSLTLVRHDAKCAVVRATPLSYAQPDSLEVRALRWGSGPLFAKLVLRIGPKGVPDAAEYTFTVPRHGAALTVTQRVLPEEPDSAETVGAKDNVLLGGHLAMGGAAPQLVKVSAGLRRLVRDVHGCSVSALVAAQSGLSLLAVPYVVTGGATIAAEGDEVRLLGPGFSRNGDANSGSLRAFWAQARFALGTATGEEALWETLRPQLQTLTAVVDEPGVTVADFSAQIAEVAKAYADIKYWGRGWQQDAGLDYLTGRTAAFEKRLAAAAHPAKPPAKDDATLDSWLPAWAKPGDGGISPPRPQGKVDTGRLDPYQISYSSSCIASYARWFMPSERLDRICLAMGEASRRVNGVIDPHGSPLITCFATALNMQIGSLHLGLQGGLKLGQPELVRFYRDLIHAQGVTGVFGRGQRPYHSLLRGGEGERTDVLYEAIADLYMRSAELGTDEDFWTHPAVYGRYFDMVDVTADLQHRTLVDDGKRVTSWWRANFFRGQSHDHRWEGWDSLPYVGLLAHAGTALPPGLTEACYFLQHRAGRTVNWADELPMVHALASLTRGLAGYHPKPSPPLPGAVAVQPGASGNLVTWTAPAGTVAGYRVYRAARMGGPWTFVNSPYAPTPAPLVAGTTFTDPQGKPGDVYWVTAVDAAGIESRWFPDEPAP